MDKHFFDLDRAFGWSPHPIVGFQMWEGKYVMVFECDIRKEYPQLKKAKLVVKRNGEYLFILTKEMLDFLASDECYGCGELDIGDEIDGEILMPDCTGF